MEEKQFTEDGYLVVTETERCPLWEIDTIPCRSGYVKSCFFCRHADFRTPESIRLAEDMPRDRKMHSVCRNEQNRKTNDKQV